MVDTIWGWSTTAAENDDADDEVDWTEGQQPGTVNNSARAMMRRVAQLMSDLKGTLVTTGTANAFLVATNTEPTTLSQGWVGVIEFDRAPTGASTLKVGSLATKTLAGQNGGAIAANMIDAGDQHWVMFDVAADEYRILTLDPRALTDHAIGDTVQAHSAVLDATEQSFTTAMKTKVDFITVTGAVNLDTIDARITALDQAVILKGNWSPSGGAFPGGGTAQAGEKYVADDNGTIDSVEFKTGDTIICVNDNASTTVYANNWVKIDNTENAATETVAGIAELATNAEAIAGTATNLIVTPAGLEAFFGDKAQDQTYWDTGTGTDEAPISAAKLKAAIETHENAGYTTFVISGTIGDDIDPCILDQKAAFGYTIDTIAHQTSSGSYSFDVEINGVNVTGMAGVTTNTTESEETATAANTVAAGDTVQINFASKASGEDFRFTMVCTRTS